MITTDIIIIGAGPTGLFAVFEAGLLKLKCHLIDALPQPGGQCSEIYPKKPIYDIPAYPEILAGDLTDKLARQVVEGVIAKEGSPSEVISKRGLKVVSDDSQLMKAIEAAITAAPETAEKVRGGNIPAAGALIGAVMKLTGGQADAAKVRELLLKHLGQ